MRSSILILAATLCLAAGAALAQDRSPSDSVANAPADAAAPSDAAAAPADPGQAAPMDQSAPADQAAPAPDNSVAAAPEGPLPIDPSIPAMTGPQILIQTSMGNITLQLDYSRAPKTVAQVLRYVRAKHYDGTVVYRVAHDALIQMGSWDAQGKGRPEFDDTKLPLEVNNGLSNVRGTVGLARGESPDSGGADFFINIGDESPLDAAKDVPGNTTGYAVFGKVAAGMDVADKINKVTTGGSNGPMPSEQTPTMPILLRSISIVPGSDSMVPQPAPAKAAAPAPKPGAKPAAAPKKK